MTALSGGQSENRGTSRREASYIRRARELERSGEYDQAIESLECAIELAPEKASYHLMLAELHRAKHRTEPAMQAIKRAVELDPDDATCQEALLQMYIEYGKFDEAIAECKRILKAQPSSVLALDVLGLAYLQQGYFDKALRVTTKLIHLNPTDSTNHFKRAVLLQQKGDCARAIEEFSRVIEMDPGGEMSEAAQQAVMVLDGLQLRQITMLAEDDGLFHAKLIRDPELAIAERGFVLSYAGIMALRQMDFATVLDMEQNRQKYYH
jgi:tetratricopeptide (TPR) repeat protein